MPYSLDFLSDFTTRILAAVGVPEADARTTASRLVEAEARGRNGHGLVRVTPYVDRLLAGGLNPRPEMTVLHETPVSAQIDADNGLGQVAVTRAVTLAATKAGESGLAAVGTVHSNHAGAAGLYPSMLAERGLVGLYFAVANANGMPPWGGVEPILGTNPVAIALPTEQGHPFLIDIATTATSHGAIKVARREGRLLPEGWVVDREGEPVTDPALADDGFLLPMAGHKGSGLTIAVGLIAGVLNGAAFGRSVVDARADLATATNTGQLVVALRADLFRPMAVVLEDLTAHLEELRTSATRDGGPVRLPGDRAAELAREHQRHGLDLPDHLATELSSTATRVGVAPLPQTGTTNPHETEEST